MKPYNIKGACGLCGRAIVIVPDEAPHLRAPEKAFVKEPQAHECPAPEVLAKEHEDRDAKHRKFVEEEAAKAEKAEAEASEAELELEAQAERASVADEEHDETHGKLA